MAIFWEVLARKRQDDRKGSRFGDPSETTRRGSADEADQDMVLRIGNEKRNSLSGKF